MNRIETSLHSLDLNRVKAEIIEFIFSVIEEAKVEGVVVGLSGGVDSSVTFLLCVEALGSDRVYAALMPTAFTPSQDVLDAKTLASKFNVKTFYIPIDDIVASYFHSLRDVKSKPMAEGNLRARVRMSILYYLANSLDLLVAGTSDRSEYMIGYFTKYGDGASDFQPIIHLYKTQVRLLARHLGLPENIAFKPSAPMLLPKHTARSELPADYRTIDQVLHGVFDLDLSIDQIEKEAQIPRRLSAKILSMVESSRHKRTLLKSVLDPFKRIKL